MLAFNSQRYRIRLERLEGQAQLYPHRAPDLSCLIFKQLFGFLIIIDLPLVQCSMAPAMVGHLMATCCPAGNMPETPMRLLLLLLLLTDRLEIIIIINTI